MASIRYKPKFNVFAQSSEVKKIVTFYRPIGGLSFIKCCSKNNIISAKKNIFDGGIPFSAGPAVKDGGIPSNSGAKVYYGGKP